MKSGDNNELSIVNYCNLNCTPLTSITRLPETEAYQAAADMASKYSGEAFYRFADFINYYPKRIRTEQWLYDWFVKLGGEPSTCHPLYFVLNSSDYLDEWFGKGIVTKIPLSSIDSKHISFTFGDSMAKMDKPERRDAFTKDKLMKMIETHAGTLDEFFLEVREQWHYIEAQLWDDTYIA